MTPEYTDKFRMSGEIVDLLSFYNTGAGRPGDIVGKMRVVLEAYCIATYPGFFNSGDTLMDIIAKIRSTGEQHPACALLDELDNIHHYSLDYDPRNTFVADDAEPFDTQELTAFVRRTLKIVGVNPD